MTYTFDEIYGLSIADYCKRHSITLNTLIDRVQLDLDILGESFMREVDSEDTDYYLTRAIADKIANKKKHLSRLKGLQNG